MVDFRNLETFVWVARLNKFHLAAEKLNTTQPAVSARIALLEQALGTKLFDRQPRRAELTASGLELLRHAERLLSLRSELLHAFGDSSAVKGVLRLGVPETIVHTWLAALVERISTDYPHVTLDIEVDTTKNLRRALVADRLDVAVLYQPGSDDGLRCDFLCSCPLGWFASSGLELPGTRLGIADLAALPIITFRRGSPSYTAIAHLLVQHRLGHGRIFGSSAIAAIVRMTLDRIGVCVLPEDVVRDQLKNASLVRLQVDCELPTLDFFVCYREPATGPLPAIVSNLAKYVAKNHRPKTRKRSKLSMERIHNED